MLLDLFIAEGGDVAWLLAGLTVVGLPAILVVLLAIGAGRFFLQTSNGIYRRRTWLVIGVLVSIIMEILL